MATTSFVLVPGFWLGAWAWDDVSAALRADGHDVTALTLPGLEAPDADRAAISLTDHVDAISAAIRGASAPVVLVVHSGAGLPGYAASDRLPESIAAMVYVDSGPATSALNPDASGAEIPLPSWEELREQGSSLDGLSPEQLETFRRRAVPEPAAAAREAASLTNDARLDIPTTVVCASLTSEQIRYAVEQDWPIAGDLARLRDVSYVDLPTGHWPMWSRPHDLATVLAKIARDTAS